MYLFYKRAFKNFIFSSFYFIYFNILYFVILWLFENNVKSRIYVHILISDLKIEQKNTDRDVHLSGLGLKFVGFLLSTFTTVVSMPFLYQL